MIKFVSQLSCDMDKDKSSNYRLQELLGQGSFGQVFKALKVDTQQIVALKQIRKDTFQIAHNAKQLELLRTELDIHKTLKHRNIIELIDYYESEKQLVLITECAERSLADLIRPGRPKYERIQQIACDIASALFYLHARRILHRDLKPENVLVGYDGITKLCDFGFAKNMALDTFLLTSFKGTPLYMAPEIIVCKPYDEKTDLWSFGCILYELLHGEPPFKTSNFCELMHMMQKPIKWASWITGDCLNFVKGLLKTHSQKRLGWPELLEHPYVCQGVIYDEKDVGEYALTKALSPSQEFAKESQRRKMERQTQAKAQARMEKMAQAGMEKIQRQFDRDRFRLQKQNLMVQNGRMAHDPNHLGPTDPNGQNYHNGNCPQLREGKSKLKTDHDQNGASDSSLDTLTSSSDCDESDDEKATIVIGRSSRKSPDSRQSSSAQSFRQPSVITDPWTAGTRLAYETPGDDDPMEIEEEWLDYLHKNIKEVIRNPESLCEKYSFRLIVQPLRNQHTGVIVVEKIAFLLSLPFALEGANGPGPTLIQNLENVYLESKVVANLMYASKLVVIRRRQKCGGGSIEFQQIPHLLKEEDLNAIEKCLRLVCFLLHSSEHSRFAIQFCDSILGFQAYVLFQLFLQLDSRRSELTADSLAILCQLMRTLPANVSILEDILFTDSGEEFWRMLSHMDARIRSCALRLVGYLLPHSEKAKDILMTGNCTKLWGILRTASTQSEAQIVTAVEFAAETLRHLGSPNLTWIRQPKKIQLSLPLTLE